MLAGPSLPASEEGEEVVDTNEEDDNGDDEEENEEESGVDSAEEDHEVRGRDEPEEDIYEPESIEDESLRGAHLSMLRGEKLNYEMVQNGCYG